MHAFFDFIISCYFSRWTIHYTFQFTQGTFYKQGHVNPTWNQRTFKIFTSKHLKYYDKTSEKGSIDITNIELVPGPAEHLKASGSSKAAFAIAVLPTDALGNLMAPAPSSCVIALVQWVH